MKLCKSLCVCLFLLAGTARADLFTFQPTPADLNDLDHYKAYRWGVNWTLPSGHVIQSASLFFDNIDNWQVENDKLYINIMNSAPVGVTTYTDDQASGNYFTQNTNTKLIYTFTDLQDNGYPEDLTVNIPSQYLSWLADGNFGFALDPDCHYWNDGITLKITTLNTTIIPEPGAPLLGLMGLGMIGAVRPRWLRRR